MRQGTIVLLASSSARTLVRGQVVHVEAGGIVVGAMPCMLVLRVRAISAPGVYAAREVRRRSERRRSYPSSGSTVPVFAASASRGDRTKLDVGGLNLALRPCLEAVTAASRRESRSDSLFVGWDSHCRSNDRGHLLLRSGHATELECRFSAGRVIRDVLDPLAFYVPAIHPSIACADAILLSQMSRNGRICSIIRGITLPLAFPGQARAIPSAS